MKFCYESLIWKEACSFPLLVFSPLFLFSSVCCSFGVRHKTIRRRHEQLNSVSFDVLFSLSFLSFSFYFLLLLLHGEFRSVKNGEREVQDSESVLLASISKSV